MVRGKSFYAIWDEEKGLWSTDEYDVQRLVDNDLMKYKEEVAKRNDANLVVKLMSDFSTKSWAEFRNYMSHISDNHHQLDDNLTFANTEVKKKDYVSRRLNYPLEKGPCEAYDELIGTLYDPEERAKLEWAIGAIISGDAKTIQKFIVLYGEAGAGKSTILNIIQKLFDGYYTAFEAKALTSSSNAFATEAFKSNPLVAIQHDGDLSKIEDNTKLNSIVSHEEMTMNEKYKPSYMARVNCFLFMGTNKPVKITDAKSGIIRRLIDVKPSGRKLSPSRYQTIMSQIDFELGGIAYHCLEVYREMGKNYYSSYKPMEMMMQTDVFYNFVESCFDVFKEQDGVSLSQAYEMYKQYCDDSNVEYKQARHKFREELKNYFNEFFDVTRVNGAQVRSYYSGFMSDKFTKLEPYKEYKDVEKPCSLVLDSTVSLIDEVYADCKAQYANDKGTPNKKWEQVITTLSEIDTREVHFVKIPENHIVIDFDLVDDAGNKSMELNLEAASKWPATYAEYSKSGGGIHLHYIYTGGDPTKLSRVYDNGIEIKVFTGNSSLRRRFSKSNNVEISNINSGLPIKDDKMINFEAVKNEKSLRTLIKKNLNKEIHAGTKPSMDFIHKILDDAYKSGMSYDVTDMRPRVLAFAMGSTNQADYCLKLMNKLQFKSEEVSPSVPHDSDGNDYVFYDVEVFPNLFIVNWKYIGEENKCVRMINPTASDIEKLLSMKLIGFNCRRYDNHIMYARYIGYNNLQLYNLSQRIINGSKNAMFSEAYNLSYTDVYDFASAGNKKSLKKFEIELGLKHMELGLPWDEPVPEDKWNLVAEYCDNDVIATEAVFNHLSADWAARQILADLAGMTVNDSTNTLTTRIIFGTNRKPQGSFCYRDMSKPVTLEDLDDSVTSFLTNACPTMMSMSHGELWSAIPYFPGYKYENGKSTYRGEEVGEGGYVYAEPGMYTNVALLDVSSMHPHSAIAECVFGSEFTARFKEIVDGRVAIKHEDWDALSKMLDGKLSKYVEKIKSGEMTSKSLANGLKTAINSVYGLTSAKFENPFRDPRNVDNIVAKRGALFMIDLKHEVQARGFTVAHIKTDSIKIPNATPEIIDFVMEFGEKYGYSFEHEETYDRMCLINDAVYIAKKSNGKWTPTGAQFGHSYVFKTLFSKEPITIDDMYEAKSVSTALYLDMNENLPEGEHDYHFIGKVGAFCPIKPGKGGGILLREKDGEYNAANGSKGFRWLETEIVKELQKEDDIDKDFFNKLVDDAVSAINKFGDFEWFVS